ncbi:LysM peptidoglycan-binding domain-containing protein [Hymenobacter oligotrophus]|uniref:LysM peptidoglycan-binding domain-containing protein n=1 Tax=Hymenobacter oligotrophus TaxID=2319843 RepID=UPI0013C2C287|nr:LysM peptidoglycan-binding domain-containing protein [Hymenobacter oligotrophus]
MLPPDSVGVVTRQNKTYVRHRVTAGETLYGLARRYRVSVEDIMEANPSIKGALVSGQEVLVPRVRALVPATAPKAAAATTTGTEAPTAAARSLPTDAKGNRVYKVQPGQTLFAISRKFGVAPAALQRYNKLATNGGVKVGQTLIIVPAGGAAAAAEPAVAAAKPVPTPPTARPERDDETEKERAKEREREADREKEREAAKTKEAEATREKDVAPPSPTATPADEPTRASEVVRKVTESGLAAVIEGGNSEKYLALHKTAPVGTIMMVRNIMNGQVVYVRVIGKLPDTGDNSTVLIRLSKKAVAKLNTPDQRFRVETSYLPD